MSIALEGYLHKQGSISSKNWHTRYFILQNNLLLRFDEKPVCPLIPFLFSSSALLSLSLSFPLQNNLMETCIIFLSQIR
jgi:hypothetical protein